MLYIYSYLSLDMHQKSTFFFALILMMTIINANDFYFCNSNGHHSLKEIYDKVNDSVIQSGIEDFNRSLRQAEECVKICEQTNIVKIEQYNNCLVAKATLLDSLENKEQDLEKKVSIMSEAAETWELEGDYSKAGDYYNKTADAAHKLEDTKNQNGILTNPSQPDRMTYLMKAAECYQKARDIPKSRIMLVDFFTAGKDRAKNDVISLILKFCVIPIVVGFLPDLIELGGARLSRWTWTTNMTEFIKNLRIGYLVYWKKLNLTIMIEILVAVWIGFAFFTSEYLNLTKTIVSLTNIDYGAWEYANNLEVEIFQYTAYYVIFQMLGIAIVSLLIIKLIQRYIPDSYIIFAQRSSEGNVLIRLFYVLSKIWLISIVTLGLTFFYVSIAS